MPTLTAYNVGTMILCPKCAMVMREYKIEMRARIGPELVLQCENSRCELYDKLALLKTPTVELSYAS